MVGQFKNDRRLRGGVIFLCVPLLALNLGPTADGANLTPEQIDFFERKVRPVLASNCYSCHSAEVSTPFANLRLDSRTGILRGGDSGPAMVPGNSGASRLVQAIRYASGLKMPPAGKLTEDEIEVLVRWIEMEAPWPDELEPEISLQTEQFDLGARRQGHWSWQPIQSNTPPEIAAVQHPVDRFLTAGLNENGLQPAVTTNRRTLIRRIYFDLTGLPPSPEEIRRFIEDQDPNAYRRLVDRLLASPRFGEHWARHWMDWVRYAESHGSEGDPDIPDAWRYRDYVIRAINNDVPYDQLIREYLAGDLLPTPRINGLDGINESILGTAHFRMVEHGFQPVDPLEDHVNSLENQIDVFSKAFQGLTVSCARCHDHKFDAISQKDFYAVLGTLRGMRPIQTVIDTPERVYKNHTEMAALKGKIKMALVEVWLDQANGLANDLIAATPSTPFIERSACNKGDALYPWAILSSKQGREFSVTWDALADAVKSDFRNNQNFNHKMTTGGWDLRGQDYTGWFKQGVGLPKHPSRPGGFWITTEGEEVLNGIYPAGVYSHGLSRKHPGVLQSPRFKVESDSISLRLLGGNFSAAKLVVENYPLGIFAVGIYDQGFAPKKDRMTWATWDTKFWKGFEAYIEIATLDDRTNFRLDSVDFFRTPKPKPEGDGRSFFGVAEVIFHNGDQPPRGELVPALHLLRSPMPDKEAALAIRYQQLLIAAIEGWRDDNLSELQALFLDDFVRNGFLETSIEKLPDIALHVTRFRQLEEIIPIPRRAPGVLAETLPPQPLLIRGNHKNPGEPVPPRYLEALDGDEYKDPRTTRLRLAEEVASINNPLTARVIVNRLWYHIFGRGIVSTVDNFGKLGEKPTHPELLDYLAAHFIQQEFSIKKMVQFLVTTEAYRRSTEASAASIEKDPTNSLLQHMPLRRIGAEAIRDAMLTISGQLDRTMYGESVKAYYVQLANLDDPAVDGLPKGDEHKGPLDGDRRRSVYLAVRRNVANPLLEVFDAPKPATARGQRDVTNVPAQSLTMMNSPFVILQATKWAETLVAELHDTVRARVKKMFVQALGREPSTDEIDRVETFLVDAAEERQIASGEILSSQLVWQDLAQAIFNFKEFLYIR